MKKCIDTLTKMKADCEEIEKQVGFKDFSSSAQSIKFKHRIVFVYVSNE